MDINELITAGTTSAPTAHITSLLGRKFSVIQKCINALYISAEVWWTFQFLLLRRDLIFLFFSHSLSFLRAYFTQVSTVFKVTGPENLMKREAIINVSAHKYAYQYPSILPLFPVIWRLTLSITSSKHKLFCKNSLKKHFVYIIFRLLGRWFLEKWGKCPLW